MQKTKKFRRLLAGLIALCLAVCIPLGAFAKGPDGKPGHGNKPGPVEPATQEVGVNYYIPAEDRYEEGSVTVAADATHVNTSALTDIPEGYQPISTGDVQINDGWIYVELEAVATTQEVGVNYYIPAEDRYEEGSVTVAADATYVNTSALTDIPEGYQPISTGDVQINDGWIYVELEAVATSTDVIMTIRFMDGDTFVSGGDYFLPKGIQNYSVLEQYLPDGYKLSVSGDLLVAEGASLDVSVEKIVKDVIMNIRFMDGDTFVSGGDYFLPEGVQNYSILNDLVPVGYEMSVSGDFMVAEGTSLDVSVEKVNDAIIVNIAFVDPYGNVVAGGDYFVPAGVQNRQVLDRYVPQGYKQAETGDILFEAGEHYDIALVEDTSIVNIRFVDMEGNFIAGGDYFVPTGIHNRSVLNQYVPEGYYQVVTGDIQFIYGQHYEIVIDRVPETATAKTAVFRKGENDVWNENPDNPDEVHYTFWSFDPDEPCTVPSITTGDKSKALDYWVCDLDETVTLQPGEDFCYNDLDQGKLEGCSGDFAFYPVYKDVTTTASNTNTVTASSDDSSDEVVKAEAPADNSTKILPQTGNQGVVSPVSFVVVLCAALAGAAVYLFAIRKKLN